MSRHRSRYGSAVVSVVVALVLLQLIIVGLVTLMRSRRELVVRRVESIKATYAAEAGGSLALRELKLGEDVDGDGVVGTISDDGNEQNDPELDGARYRVVIDVLPDGVWIVSTGRCGQAQRDVRVLISGV